MDPQLHKQERRQSPPAAGTDSTAALPQSPAPMTPPRPKRKPPTMGSAPSPKTTTASLPLPPSLLAQSPGNGGGGFGGSSRPPMGRRHRKAQSLMEFDPLMATSTNTTTTTAPGDDADNNDNNSSSVWTSLSSFDAAAAPHPLLASSSGSTTATSSSGKPPLNRPPRGRHRPHSYTVCASDLRDIAQQLSIDKPRALTKEEQEEEQSMMNRMTLGESVKDSTTKEDRKLIKHAVKQHRKTKSMEEIILALENDLGSATTTSSSSNNKKAHSPPPSTDGSAPTTPERAATTTKASPGGNILRAFHHRTGSHSSFTSTPPPQNKPPLHIPTLSKPSPTSFLTNSQLAVELRSSEQEPTPHQLEISSARQLHLNAKLLVLMDSCVEQNLSMESLEGVSKLELQGFVSLGKPILGLMRAHHTAIARVLLACDVVVEGHLQTDAAQVTIFASQAQIFVLFRGTDETQAKPVHKKSAPTALLDQEHPYPVYEPFRDAYLALESTVQKLLDRLSDENPFAEVVFGGYSFGGALATLAASRFASARPMTRFACHTFGSPKVGQLEYRQYVHSLPNLKVMRVEYGTDPNTLLPADSGEKKWHHVGHTIAITKQHTKQPQSQSNLVVTAYRFGNHKKAPNAVMGKLGLGTSKHVDMQKYERLIGECAADKLPWPKHFVGEDRGEGVVGKDNETRNMA